MKRTLWLPPSYREVGAQQQQNRVDPNRLRWGDIYNLVLPLNSEAPNPITQQIVNAHASGLPETWTVFLFTAIDHMPPGGVAITIVYNITLGVGASTVTFPFTFFYGPAIVTPPVFSPYEIDSGTVTFGFHTMVIPAKDIQVNAVVSRSGNDSLNNIQVGAWVAPRVPAILPPSEHGHHGWMGPGFNPEHLHYK